MNRKDVALGRAAIFDSGVGIVAKPKTVEERVAILEAKVKLLTEIVDHLNKGNREEDRVQENVAINKDGIPYDINLIGSVKGQPYVLTVRKDAYYLGAVPHKTLSAAAKSVCGHRKSGWVFWKVPDGRTAKETFGRK